MDILMQIVESPFFDPIFYFVLTFFGTVAMYVFANNKGFQGATEFLKKMFPGRPDVFHDRADFVVVIVAGSIIGTIFFTPGNPVEAFTAGFGWVGAINVLLQQQGG